MQFNKPPLSCSKIVLLLIMSLLTLASSSKVKTQFTIIRQSSIERFMYFHSNSRVNQCSSWFSVIKNGDRISCSVYTEHHSSSCSSTFCKHFLFLIDSSYTHNNATPQHDSLWRVLEGGRVLCRFPIVPVHKSYRPSGCFAE